MLLFFSLCIKIIIMKCYYNNQEFEVQIYYINIYIIRMARWCAVNVRQFGNACVYLHKPS